MSESSEDSSNGGVISVDLGLDDATSNLAEPVNTLIEKLASGAGYLYEPVHEKRMASAEKESRKIRAETQIEISKMLQKEMGISENRSIALARVIGEESIKKSNRDEIIEKALPKVSEDAEPEKIDNDWIMSFLNKCELTSDKDIQLAWSKILSGEANNPGSYSKRTVNKLSNIDKDDAKIFKSLCSFLVNVDDNIYAFVTNNEDFIYEKNDINVKSLSHLDEIGLISFRPVAGLRYEREGKSIFSTLTCKFSVHHNGFSIGEVLLSSVGREMSTIIEPEEVDGFNEHVKQYLQGQSDIESVEIL